MAKRAPVDQKPFTALDKGLAASVMIGASTEVDARPEISGSAAVEVTPPAREPVRIDVSRREADPTPAFPLRITPPVTARQPVLAAKPIGADHANQEKLSREKRVLLTPSEEREIERCVDRIAEGFGGTPVKMSHLVRACLTVMRHSETEVIKRAQEAGQLTRPPNGDVLALAEFEHELAKVLSQAFRDAPALR